jgi:hypothetical protein
LKVLLRVLVSAVTTGTISEQEERTSWQKDGTYKIDERERERERERDGRRNLSPEKVTKGDVHQRVRRECGHTLASIVSTSTAANGTVE